MTGRTSDRSASKPTTSGVTAARCGGPSLGVRGVGVRMRDQSRSGAARSSKAPDSRPPRLAVLACRRSVRRSSRSLRHEAPLAVLARPRCRPKIQEAYDHGRPAIFRTTLRGSPRSSAELRSAEPSLASLARTPLRLATAVPSIGRPRRLPKPAIAGSERIGDPRSTEELRSSGMTNDGSASRRSNHDHRTPSYEFLAQLRRAGCRQCRQPIPWRGVAATSAVRETSGFSLSASSHRAEGSIHLFIPRR